MVVGRYPKSQPFSASVFLYDAATQSLLLHLRDDKAPTYPNTWAFFGGRGEAGETDVECCLRELKEETGLDLRPDELQRLREYVVTERKQYQIIFYAEKAVPLDELVLGEGAGIAWVALADVASLAMNKYNRDDVRYFANKLGFHTN
jgi:8-oxo-dGTP diphosphatase